MLYLFRVQYQYCLYNFMRLGLAWYVDGEWLKMDTNEQTLWFDCFSEMKKKTVPTTAVLSSI